jgi:galactokinase
VTERAQALQAGDMDRFLALTRASGASSAMYLQNVSVAGAPEQPAMVALALAEELAGSSAAVRIHGGGFGGTIQVFLPVERAEEFSACMDALFGEGACGIYQIDTYGVRAWRLA